MINSVVIEQDTIHVAVGVVFNSQGQVLVALRPNDVDQGGLWEFPGGKVEPGETAQVALARELHEETGITVQRAIPLVQVRHDYPQRKVLLDVWRITAFHGEAYGREGQVIQWVLPCELTRLCVPAANAAIVKAVIAAAELFPFHS